MADAVIGYCVKCRDKREMAETEKVEMKGKGDGPGRPAMKGKCGTCSTGMYKILPKE